MILGIQKQPGANTLELTRTLDATLDDIQRTLPAGMTIDRQSSGRRISSSALSPTSSTPCGTAASSWSSSCSYS